MDARSRESTVPSVGHNMVILRSPCPAPPVGFSESLTTALSSPFFVQCCRAEIQKIDDLQAHNDATCCELVDFRMICPTYGRQVERR